MASWQQVLALDAKFNNFRAPNDPAFKRLYLRRRNHLLRTSSQFKSDVLTATSVTSVPELNFGCCKDSISSSSTTNLSCGNINSYLQIRTHLLQQKYKVCLDQLSHRSSRPPSRVTLIAGDNGGTGQLSTAFRSAIASSGFGSGPGYSGISSRGSTSQCASGVVPTVRARASLAIVGGTTLGENYAFSGVHHIFDQHKGVITMVKFGHNDSSLFCCSSLDGTVTVCHAGEEATILHTLTAHQSPVMGVDWSSSNDLLASCSCDGTVCVWCAETGTCLRMRPPAVPGQTALVVLFHPLNSNWLVVGGSDGNMCGRVQVLVLSTGRVVQGGTASTPAPITALAFDDQGTMLWAGDDKGSISSFHVKVSSGGLRAGRRTLLTPPGAAVTHLEHRTWASREARDPSLLVSAACDALLLFSVVDGDGGLSQRCRLPVPHQHHRSLRATFPPLMSFREGAAVVSGSEDGCVLFLDTEKPQRPLINKLQGHAAAVLSPAFNYTESLLATGDAAGIVIVWKRQHEAE